MTIAMENRRSVAAEHLESLRRGLGSALLDGGNPAGVQAKIATVELELEAIDAAEAETVRRQRELRAAADEARISTLRTRLLGQETERLAAVQQAEASARSLVIALRTALDASDEVRRTMQELGARLPDSFDSLEAEKRLSFRLAPLLATASKHPARFGVINWRPALFNTAADDWYDLELREGEKALASFINEGKRT